MTVRMRRRTDSPAEGSERWTLRSAVAPRLDSLMILVPLGRGDRAPADNRHADASPGRDLQWKRISMIRALAFITAKPGLRPEVLAHFRANMPAVHAEKGCIEYQPFVDAPGGGAMQEPLGDDAFVVVEAWATMEDLKAHAASDHMAAYRAKVEALLAGRTIRILTHAAA